MWIGFSNVLVVGKREIDLQFLENIYAFADWICRFCFDLITALIFGNKGKDHDLKWIADFIWNLNLFSRCLRPPLVGMEIILKNYQCSEELPFEGHTISSDNRNSSLDMIIMNFPRKCYKTGVTLLAATVPRILMYTYLYVIERYAEQRFRFQPIQFNI